MLPKLLVFWHICVSPNGNVFGRFNAYACVGPRRPLVSEHINNDNLKTGVKWGPHVRGSSSVCSYRGEDMQDGVNVPALGGGIPDRDRDTHIQWCSGVTHTHISICKSIHKCVYNKNIEDYWLPLKETGVSFRVETDTEWYMKPHTYKGLLVTAFTL